MPRFRWGKPRAGETEQLDALARCLAEHARVATIAPHLTEMLKADATAAPLTDGDRDAIA